MTDFDIGVRRCRYGAAILGWRCWLVRRGVDLLSTIYPRRGDKVLFVAGRNLPRFRLDSAP